MKISIDRYRNRRILLYFFLLLVLGCLFIYIKRGKVMEFLQKNTTFKAAFWAGKQIKNVEVQWGKDIVLRDIKLHGKWGGWDINILSEKVVLDVSSQQINGIICHLENAILDIKKSERKEDTQQSFVITTDFGKEFKMPVKEPFIFSISNGSVNFNNDTLIRNAHGIISVDSDEVLVKNLTADVKDISVIVQGRLRKGEKQDTGYFDITCKGIQKFFNVKDKKFLKRKILPSDTFSVRAVYINGVWDINTNIEILEEKFVIFAKYKPGAKVINFSSIEGIGLLAEGIFDIEKKEIQIQTKIPDRLTGENKGEITVLLRLDAQKIIWIIDLKDVKIAGDDLHTRITGSANVFFEDNHLKISEAVTTLQNTLLNQKPFREIKCQFSIVDGILTLHNLAFGIDYIGSGKIALEKPFPFELRLDVIDADLKDIIEISDMKKGILEGKMNGFFSINGNFLEQDTYHISGTLRGSGRMWNLPFTFAVPNIDGRFPFLELKDSFVMSGEHKYRIVGNIDLRNLKEGNPYENIRLLSEKEQIIWDGWDITKDVHGSKVIFKRSVGENVNLGFTVNLQEQRITGVKDESKATTKVDVEYGLSNNNSVKFSIDEKGEFLGLQRRFKF